MKYIKQAINIFLIVLITLAVACQKNEVPIEEEDTEIYPPELDVTIETYTPEKFQDGYTLVAPITSRNSYLVDMEGFVVHKWACEYPPNNSTYLLENGKLLRPEKVESNTIFSGRGRSGGRIALYSLNGNLEWAWNYSTNEYCQHHDIELLPNGNILLIAWEARTMEEATNGGKIPEFIDSVGVWPERIVEIQPSGKSGANIVWEWHQWDHLIQDFDSTKANYGDVASHPELIDFNFTKNKKKDISHFNGVDYIVEHDLIIISAHNYSEIWIIDHSTTTAEASSHTGGNRNKGGDLVYRWGNPAVYQSGTEEDQLLFLQHDAVWLGGLPSNGGNLLFFNNGGINNRDYSTVDEILLPINPDGNFELLPNKLNWPETVAWRFEQEDFFSPSISGAQRLPNGNTLICEGTKGMLHEVTPSKEIVWQFNNPMKEKSIFRAYRYPKDYDAFKGITLERLNISVE